MLRPAVTIATLALILTGTARASSDPTAPGHLDLGYGTNGIFKTFLGGSRHSEVPIQRAIVLRDGRVVTLAQTRTVGRIAARGSADDSFGFEGATHISLGGDGNDSLQDLAVGPDGSVVLVGTRRADQLAIMRLTRYGLPDPAFDGGAATLTIPANGFITNVATALAPGGTIYVSYAFTDGLYGYGTGREVVRAFHPDGTADTAFGTGGAVELPVSQSYQAMPRLVRLADGALRFLALRSGGRGHLLAGLDANGRPDTRLGPDGLRALGLSIQPVALSAAPGDRMLLTGWSASRAVVARLNADGTVDPAFGSGGVARLSRRAATVPGPAAAHGAGLVAVALSTPSVYFKVRGRMAVELLHGDGTPVRSFGDDGFLALRRRRSPAVTNDVGFDRLGGLILAGSVGDGLSGIREDFGADAELFARVRTRRASVQVGRRWIVGRRGVVRVPLRCIAVDTFICTGRLGVGRASVRFDMHETRSRTLRLPRGALHVPRGGQRRVRVRVVQRPDFSDGPIDRFTVDVRVTRPR